MTDEQACDPNTVPLAGVSESEAAILYAVARFGGGDEIVKALEEEAAQCIQGVVRALQRKTPEQRQALANAWTPTDLSTRGLPMWRHITTAQRERYLAHMEPRWANAAMAFVAPEASAQTDAEDFMPSAIAARMLFHDLVMKSVRPARSLRIDDGNLHLCTLVEWSGREILDLAMDFGLFQFSSILKTQSRRHIARTLHALSLEQVESISVYLEHERELDPEERARINEVFVALGPTFPGLQERVHHVGLYFLASLAGYRLERMIALIAKRLEEPMRSALLDYHQRHYTSSRRGVSALVHKSLQVFHQLNLSTRGER